MFTNHDPQPWEVGGCYDPSHPVAKPLHSLIAQVSALKSGLSQLQASLTSDFLRVSQGWSESYEALRMDAELEAPISQTHGFDAPPVKQPRYIHALDEWHNVGHLQAAMGPSMLLTLVAKYDTFVGDLFRAMFALRPELLRAGELRLRYVDFQPEGVQRDVTEVFIDREVNELLRKGHEDQLTALGKRLGLEKMTAFDTYKEFIELTERRNLVAHNGGRVILHYLDRTGREGKVGDQLEVDEDYFCNACDVIVDVATRLAHTVWRKIAPRELALADRDLSQITYLMLVREEWLSAQRLLKFVIDRGTFSSDTHGLVFQINYAQTFKWLGNQKACDNILDKVDWGARDIAFRLSAAVLGDRFAEAEQLMIDAARAKHIRRAAFDHWPIYREFRLTPEYRRAYLRSFSSHSDRDDSAA